MPYACMHVRHMCLTNEKIVLQFTCIVSFQTKKCCLFQSFFCKSLVRFILCEYFFSYLSFVKEPFVKTVAFARPQARPRPSRARHRWPRRGRSPSAVEPRDPTAARPPFKKKAKLRMDSNSLVMDSIRRIHDIMIFHYFVSSFIRCVNITI